MAQVEGSGTAETEPYSISGILNIDEVKVAEVNGVGEVNPKKPKVLVSKVVNVVAAVPEDVTNVAPTGRLVLEKMPKAVIAVGKTTVKPSLL